MSGYNLKNIHDRYELLRTRLEALREYSPYRFYNVDNESIRGYLNSVFIPFSPGWVKSDIDELDRSLPKVLPSDYKLYLQKIGNLNSLLAGHYECPLRSVDDYLLLQDDVSEFDKESWKNASTNVNFQQILKNGVAFDCFGGCAIGFFVANESLNSEVVYWYEKSDGKQFVIQSKGKLIDFIELRFSNLEHRIRKRQRFGYLVTKTGSTFSTMGGNEEFNFLRLPHEDYTIMFNEATRIKFLLAFPHSKNLLR